MRFIDAHDFPVGLVLRVLGIEASTYYDWRARQVDAEPTGARGRGAAGADLKVGRARFAAPTGRRGYGWSCAAEGCGSAANGWSG